MSSRPLVRHRSASSTFRLAAGVTVVVLGAWSAVAVAAPPPPPGGHHRTYSGGDNRPGYPTGTTAVQPPALDVSRKLVVEVVPNPFRTATHFRFTTLPGEASRVRVFSSSSRLVREISGGREGGARQAVWDGRDQKGRRLPAGLYLYRVDAGTRSARGKLVYLR
ncbi:MAG TPA: FlgD immunoglobulin-like domain containing protein [Candidatus Limnocylindria bacterium]|nr:FlgD immunoglobulin-like domain containing protein [Candidatus Limnocylindria bacterium]